MRDFSSIPELDWGLVSSGDPAHRADFLRQLRDVLLHVGFMYLKNHPVPSDLVNKIKRHTVSVFDLPLQKKLKMDMLDSPHFYGYNRLAFERTAGAPDIREHIDLGPDSPSVYNPSTDPLYRRMRPGPNPWPDEEDAPGFKEDARKYVRTLAPLSREFIKLVAESIGLPRGAFDKFLEDESIPQGRIKMVHYPPTSAPNAQGVGPHKDGWLTFLLQVNDVPGLQVQNHSGKWIDVPPREGTFVVNLGKGLQYLTRGVLLATTHRVLPPPPGMDRYSCPFFQDVALEVPWEPLEVPEDVRLEVVDRGEVVSDVQPLEPSGASDGWQYLANRIKSHPATGVKHYPEFAREVLGEDVYAREVDVVEKLTREKEHSTNSSTKEMITSTSDDSGKELVLEILEADSSTAVPGTAIKEAEKTDLEAVETTNSNGAGTSLRPKDAKFWLLLFGLLLSIFLAALDQSIVSTAVPKIITDFQDLKGISWISTAYLVTTTALIPIYGKLGTIFGLKRTYLSAIFLFEFGSLLCGTAVSMPMLIVGRAVAGLGVGGLFINVIVMISGMVSQRENAKYMSSFALVYAVSGVCGPLVGGALTDTVGWRWCFFLNLPLGAITVVAVLLLVPPDERSPGGNLGNLRRVDFPGCILLCASMVLILIPLSLGGVQFAWTSGLVLGMLIVGFLLIPVLAFFELRHPEPIILPSLFLNRPAVVVFAASLFGGMVYNTVVYYVPIY
ncbi:hypothetical protein HDU93_004248, partial [Gonapodya sp. JEL0774]